MLCTYSVLEQIAAEAIRNLQPGHSHPSLEKCDSRVRDADKTPGKEVV